MRASPATSANAQRVSALMELFKERWVLTLATNAPGDDSAGHALIPYPTPLFYAPIDLGRWIARPAPALIFASSPRSTRGFHLGAGPTPAGAALYLETELVSELRGVQLQGVVLREDRLAAPIIDALRSTYLARHPVAAAILNKTENRPADAEFEKTTGHALYALAVTWAKITDNRRRFGHHEIHRFADPWAEVASLGQQAIETFE